MLYDYFPDPTNFQKKLVIKKVVNFALIVNPCHSSNPDSATYKKNNLISLWLNFLF